MDPDVVDRKRSVVAIDKCPFSTCGAIAIQMGRVGGIAPRNMVSPFRRPGFFVWLRQQHGKKPILIAPNRWSVPVE